MSGFPLFDPPLHLVERILAKVDRKANYRLRQTCHIVGDFIRASSKIIAHVPGYFSVVLAGPSAEVSLDILRDNVKQTTDVVYGTRFMGIFLPRDVDEQLYNVIYETLKKQRITSGRVDLSEGLHLVKFIYAAVECGSLIRRIQSDDVQLIMNGPTRSPEGICDIKDVKEICLPMKEDDVIPAMGKLLPSYSHVDILASHVQNRFQLLHNVLNEFKLIDNPQNIRTFTFTFTVVDRTTQEELETEFPDLTWEPDQYDGRFPEDFSAVVELPFPKDCFMSVEFDDDSPSATYSFAYGIE